MSSGKKISVKKLRKKKERGEKIVAVTAYDARMAELAEQAGIELLLVGDSVGMTTLGYKTTVPVTLEQSLHHTAAVARGVTASMVVGDMPFLTYNVTEERALLNAGRYLQEAGADAVKLEGGKEVANTVSRLVQAGIPVMAHIGLLPQNVYTEGGYKVKGKTETEKLLTDAEEVEKAGAFAVVCEGTDHDVAAQITEHIGIPTIGIGAGIACDGQIQVVHDLLGFFEEFVPKHTHRYANLSEEIRNALSRFRTDVVDGNFPESEGHGDHQ